MHFSTATATAILAVLLPSALAGPITRNPAAPSEIMKRDSINDCEDSSFQNDTSDASPLVDDCLTIASNIAGGGTWHLGPWRDLGLASFGTCIFGADSDAIAVKVGNQDIIDLIHSSIDMFQSNGKIGASGHVDCQNDGAGGTNTVRWGIYHS